MKTEDELGFDPADPPVQQEGLFTDNANADGGAPMLSGMPDEFDGAEAPTPAPEQIDAKGGKKLLRVSLGGDKFLVGETERELLEKAIKGKIAADQALADRENQIRTLKAQPPVVTTTNVAPPVPAATTRTEAFDGQKYLTMLGENPLEAIKYANSYVDTVPHDLVAKIENADRVAQTVQQNMIAAEFHRRNPDWTPTDENAAKLLGVVASEGIANPNIRDLEWAKNELIRRGEITPMATDPNTYEDITFGQPAAPPQGRQPQQRTSRGSGAAPVVRGSSARTEPEAVDAETMPLEQLRELLRKKGALQF